MKDTNKLSPEIRFSGFTDDWEQRKLGEILKYEQPSLYIVDNTDYDDSFLTPVLTAGQSFILGYTNETEGIKYASKENPVIIFDDFTTSSHLVDFPFKVKSSAMKLLSLRKNEDDIYFMVNTLKNIKYIPASHERHWISIFSEFNIPIPCNNVEQQKIGEYFSNLDHLITLHQRKLNGLKNVKKAMLEKMFPKNGESVPEIRFSGFTDDWELRKLGAEVINIGTGRSSFTSGVEKSNETPFPVLGSTSIISYDSEFDHLGDFVLTARVGANAGNLYKYAGNVKISDNTVYIQSNNLNFIFYLLTKFDVKKLSFGTGQPLIKASELKNLSLHFPIDDEQQRIGSFFQQLDNTIALHQRKLDKLKTLKKAMLEKMFI